MEEAWESVFTAELLYSIFPGGITNPVPERQRKSVTAQEENIALV